MGVGMHFGGMSAPERSAVEMLFRMKMLNIVIATGTLALGIHMPCKTVVIAGDSVYLNPLEFQQMSGRAGRRGFDITGNVIFMGLNDRKMKSLIIGDLPKMIGNFPLSVTMILRMLLLVNSITSRGLVTEESTRSAFSRCLTLLNCCLVYETIPELKSQMKHFFAFSVQLLMLPGLLDDAGKPQFLTGIVTHLNYHEPGNLAFVFLMKSGALRKLCQITDGKVSLETQMNLIIVLSYLFAPLKLHANAVNKQYYNSKVILPPLPNYVREVLEDYNEQVLYIFDNYFKSVADHCFKSMGEDNVLPMSKTKFEPKTPFNLQTEGCDTKTLEQQISENSEQRTICSSFAALSGQTDEQLYSHRTASNIRHDVFTDVKIVPLLELDEVYNGYAWDFYTHGIAAAMQRDNNLRQGDDFAKLLDFLLVLQCIETSLSELEPLKEDDAILKTFKFVTEEFNEKFYKAYGKK
ncbi:hypothetical protein L9F63_012537 [Diploptera punctata]|uniref:Helicase C-terminal domain-containing protein n=1 Tax=Diploptera punctata TaxID=6984 RepID=A0AAD8AEI4_DIPPU|nr:hypothetical protein L9F63_012537 [Diploptera punctata]